MVTVTATVTLPDGRLLTARARYRSDRRSEDINWEGATDAIPASELVLNNNYSGLELTIADYARMTGGTFSIETSGHFDEVFDDAPPGRRAPRPIVRDGQ
jgi:hypothetical protein